jgi:hypothetical protein
MGQGSPIQTGLINNPTKYFNLFYINTLSAANGEDLCNNLIPLIDNDWSQASTWFNIPQSQFGFHIQINLTILDTPWTDSTNFNPPQTFTGQGAYWAGDSIFVYGAGSDTSFARYLMFSELTEQFMATMANGWGYSFGDIHEATNGKSIFER